MENEINIAYPIISVICYITIEALKKTPLKSQFYPLISLILGGILGGIGNYYLPEVICAVGIAEAIVLGALCGLAATGGNQVYRQALELMGK